MRTNEPDSAEYFAKTIGTRQTTKLTSRQKKSVLGAQDTGDMSARDTEEFIYHPNIFKSELGLGEAVVLFPHNRGSKAVRVKFQKMPYVPKAELPLVAKYKP